jgi:hypothetical protein
MYWEQRYDRGETSGCGSYGRLATFKAEVVNTFVAEKNIQSVIEFGCGDGNQLTLAHYPNYIGLDVSEKAINLCQSRFSDDPTKRFLLYNPAEFAENSSLYRAELAISLDVIFHLVEDDIFETYLNQLFSGAERYVIIYSSNVDLQPGASHVRHRCFTRWIEEHINDWLLVQKIPNKYPFLGNLSSANPTDTSFSDFYVYEKANL